MQVLCVGDLFLSSDRFREAMEKEMGKDFEPIREVSWAGEKAEDQHHLQQIMEQDGLEAVPTPEEIVEVTGAGETGTLGAALCAGVGIGVYDSLNDATENVVRKFRTHEPDARNSERYAEAYETYMGLVSVLEPVWPRLG